ncbi:hypothetical protein ACFWVC_22370 [Streptomyces sp. NPDC058691]|uniref:hypothetical protein n=1 Tax=Streptomyces sp. NPDC058691 TaxID=3346601 RepID=UPI003651DC52
MSRWGLFVEETVGSGGDRRWEFELLGHADGSREDALRALERTAQAFRPRKPMTVRRSWTYRTADALLQVNEGMTATYICRFTVAELIADSKDASVTATPRDRVPEGY